MARFLRRRLRRVLIDIDTQYDLVYSNGQDRSGLIKNIRRLIAWARFHHLPVISTALTRRSDSTMISRNCIEDTTGQQKLPLTILAKNIRFGPENRLDLPRHILSDYQQIIFEKRTHDPFTQPRADRLLSEYRADEFIICGMDIEGAVKATVLGLLSRRKRVSVVIDAIDSDDPKTAQLALRQMEAKGAKLITTEQLTGKSRLTGKVAAYEKGKNLFSHSHPY